MADFSKPVLSDLYQNVLQYIRDLFADAVKWLDGTSSTNVPTGAKRWNATTKRFEKYDGVSWVELIPKATDKYDINVDRVDGYDVGNGASNILLLDASGKVPASNLTQTAAVTSFTPAGSIAATNVQAAIQELDGDVTGHTGAASGAHAASAISNTPAGGVSATTVQAAINELDSDLTTVNNAKADKTITISAGAGLTGGGDLSANRTLAIASTSNGYGTRTVSTASPTGGVDGDIWYQV